MYCYELSPIDWGWDNLKTVHQTASEIMYSNPMPPQEEDESEAEIKYDLAKIEQVQNFLFEWQEAQDYARQAGWEGEFTKHPRVFWLPSTYTPDMVPGFIIKQRNNGSVFVVSPVEMHFSKD